MSTFAHGIPESSGRQKPLQAWLTREMWASLAIVAMWLTVILDALFGPNIVSTTPGGTSTSVPSAVVVSVFAFFGTWVVARYGLRDRQDAR